MKKLTLLLFQILLFQYLTAGQPPARTTVAEYIQKYREDAIKDMHKMGVPASITLAQGILESESGNSDLAKQANNHFGIKCHTDWSGATFHKDDDAKDECFRKYNSVLESYDDHSRFLRERSRYAFLFEYEVSDYKNWAHGLKKAGYATNPRYADLLIKLIEEHDLDAFDKGGRNMPIVAGAVVQPIAKAPEKHPAKAPHKTTTKTPHLTKPGVFISELNVPYVVAQNDDSWLSIALSNDMRLWQIQKYNDANENTELKPGERVYLKPKRGRPTQQTHIVHEGEDLRSISQFYGVKMNKLIKLNSFTESVTVTPGQTIKLR